MDIITFLGIAYLLSIAFNVVLSYLLKTFDVNLSGKFTIVYWLLSPFTLFYTINESLEYWYNTINNKNDLIKYLRNEVENTKYSDVDDNTLFEMGLLIGYHTEYIQWSNMEEIFDDMVNKGYISKDENGKYYVSRK